MKNEAEAKELAPRVIQDKGGDNMDIYQLKKFREGMDSKEDESTGLAQAFYSAIAAELDSKCFRAKSAVFHGCGWIQLIRCLDMIARKS